jgi:hypothetical protein
MSTGPREEILLGVFRIGIPLLDEGTLRFNEGSNLGRDGNLVVENVCLGNVPDQGVLECLRLRVALTLHTS